MFYGDDEKCGGFKNECGGCSSCEETVRFSVRRVVARRCPSLPVARKGDVVVRTTGFVFQSGGGPRLRYLPARQEVKVYGRNHSHGWVGVGADAAWLRENADLVPFIQDRQEVSVTPSFWNAPVSRIPVLLEEWLVKASAFEARWGHGWAHRERTVSSVKAEAARAVAERTETARLEQERYMQNFWAKGAEVGAEFKWNGQTLRKTNAGRSVPSWYTDTLGELQEYYGTAVVFGAVNVETGAALSIRVE